MTKDEAKGALRQIAGIIVETVKETGPDGAPSGHIYAALMQFGCTLEQYEQLMAALVALGRLRQRGHLYFAA